MDRQERIAAIKAEIQQLWENLSYLNERCGKIFDKTLIKEEELEFARLLPDYALFRHYKIRLNDCCAALEDEISGNQNFNERMELIFYIAAEYALLGNIDKMNIYAARIDPAWRICNSKNPDVIQIARELILRGRELEQLEAAARNLS